MTDSTISEAGSENLGDDQFQAVLLDGVSRTFALTIPQLPQPLGRYVANAYLLCRIVDTIEDEVALTSTQKRQFCDQFVAVVTGQEAPSALRDALAPLLSEQTLPAEHDLIRSIPRVIGITHGFPAEQREALACCIRVMAHGMAEFQDRDLHAGLATMDEMSEYCYYVAGVVGEMLTELFCLHSPEIAARRDEMLKLAVSFGQGLQMTNILKDLWDDHDRRVCWLPRDIFDAAGFDLAKLEPGQHDPAFRAGFREVLGIAHGHLRNALTYTLLIPAHETGIREFCLWALGMAVLTLRKINGHIDFDRSVQVKITRRSVKATVLTSRLFRSIDSLLKLTFALASRGLPKAPPAAALLEKPSNTGTSAHV